MILVLPAIKFNHYFPFYTREIDNVLSNGMLAAKPMAIKLFYSQCPPKQTFGIRHVMT